MRGGTARTMLAAGAVLAIAVAVLLWRRVPERGPVDTPPPAAPPEPTPQAGGPAPVSPPVAAAPAADPPVAEAPAADPPPAAPPAGSPPDDPIAAAWAKVDLTAVRAAMPDNLYWSMSAPTKDPEVLRRRDEERARWNVEYGKVLSNTATEAEVDAYFAHRRRLSTDYIDFASYVLEHYGRDLQTRDIALLKLAIEMHLARLEEIPRQQAEAHERRVAHDAARRAWREQQEQFAPPPPSDD